MRFQSHVSLCLFAVVLAVFALLAASPRSASAQAWTRDQGSFYVQLSHRFIRAGSLYRPDGSLSPPLPGDYVQHVLGLYSEVGLVDRWLTLSLEGELFRANSLKNQGSVRGIGDLRAGLWTGLLVAPFRLAAGVLVGLPTGDESPSAGPNADAVERAVIRSLPTGDGEFDVHFRLAAGHSFGGGKWPLQHYALFELGYALRTKGFTDQITYRGELGTSVDRDKWDRLMLIVRLSGTELLGDVGSGGSVVGIGEYTVTSYGLELLGRTWDTITLSFGVDGAFRGKNVPAAPQYKFGISWEH